LHPEWFQNYLTKNFRKIFIIIMWVLHKWFRNYLTTNFLQNSIRLYPSDFKKIWRKIFKIFLS
jgi:predicted RNA-binding protein